MSVVANDVMQLVEYGLYPVRLHYPIFEDGKTLCSCGNPACPPNSRGKHPVGNQWGRSATQDLEIIEANWRGRPWNVGIVLGPCHGIPESQAIIDIEDDNLEGRALADSILRDYPSPTYTSGKSLHRLYRWTPDLLGVANVTINGLEFRFGGPGKETQSVAPPSMHPSGKQYQWVEGKSLADIPLTPLPQHVIEYVRDEYTRQGVNSPKGTSTTDPAKFRSPMGKIGPGARHNSLLTYANSCWRVALKNWGINMLEEQETIDQVWMWLAGANLLVCDPPKSEAELQVLFQSSQKFMMAEFLKEFEANTDITEPKPAVDANDRSMGAWLHKHGIRMVQDPNADPSAACADRIDEWVCDWSMSFITKGDEDLIQLKIPDMPPIHLKSAEFESAQATAKRIQTDTEGKMQLAKTFPMWDWRSIWEGRANDKKRQNGITRGLKEYLQTNAMVEEQESNSLADQVEGILSWMFGPISVIQEKIEYLKEFGHSIDNWKGRLKLIPGTNELSDMKSSEDPISGLFMHEGKLMRLVKFDEVSKRHRGAFGGTVNTRSIKQSLEKLKYQNIYIRKGPLEGRWFAKEVE